MLTLEQNERYQDRMKRKKAIIDERIANATEERGVLILMKGNGKGKSSSALGTMARSVGHGKKCGVIQFIKGRDVTGEFLFFKDHPMIDWHVMGHGFTWETQDHNEDTQAAEKAWAIATDMLNNPEYGLIVFDEMSYPLKYKNLQIEPVIEALQSRPEMQNVIVTGRAMPKELEEIADTISEVRDERHAFRLGVKAQAGIEF